MLRYSSWSHLIDIKTIVIVALLLILGISAGTDTRANQLVTEGPRLTWEMIDQSPQHHMKRAKIPGGWLVRFVTHGRQWGGGGIEFVPDPKHAWKID